MCGTGNFVMDAETRPSLVRKDRSLQRVGSSSFVSRHKQLIEGKQQGNTEILEDTLREGGDKMVHVFQIGVGNNNFKRENDVSNKNVMDTYKQNACDNIYILPNERKKENINILENDNEVKIENSNVDRSSENIHTENAAEQVNYINTNKTNDVVNGKNNALLNTSDNNGKIHEIISCSCVCGLKKGTNSNTLFKALPVKRNISHERVDGQRGDTKESLYKSSSSPKINSLKQRSPRNTINSFSAGTTKSNTSPSVSDGFCVKDRKTSGDIRKKIRIISPRDKNASFKSKVDTKSSMHAENTAIHNTFAIGSCSSLGTLVEKEKQSSLYDETSLKLSLGELNDSDSDDFDEEDGDILKVNEFSNKNKNRCSIPEKECLATPNLYNSRPSVMRELDGNKTEMNCEMKTPKKPIIKQALKIGTLSDSSEKLDTFSEIFIPRTSSGRKLPVPNERPIRAFHKSQSANSFLSIHKDGLTEYVALDFSKDILNENKSSQTESLKTIDRSVIYGNVRNMTLSPRKYINDDSAEKKTIVRSSSIDQAFNASLRVSATVDKSKPPLERRSSKGTLQPSPRGSKPPSPRNSVTVSSPRNSASSQVNTSPQMRQASPRGVTTSQTKGVSQASPREATKRKTPRTGMERKSSVEKVKAGENAFENNMKVELTSSSSAKPVLNELQPKASRCISSTSGEDNELSQMQAFTSQCMSFGDNEEADLKGAESSRKFNRHSSCTSMNLQQIIAVFNVSANEQTDSLVITEAKEAENDGNKQLKDQSDIKTCIKAKTETEVQSEKTWLHAERVWLVHKGGFASASQLKGEEHGLAEGQVKIKLDHGGEILDVDEDDVEKANPPQMDRVEDLSLLRYLNESSALHTVRQRYGGNLIHTYAGPSLIIVNPMQPLQIYSEKVIQMFKGCKQEDMPPHIFASAQIAYREMLSTRQDQSIVLMGRSGSGKTYNAHHLVHYLALTAGSVNNVLTVDKLNAVSQLLGAFGNSKTIMNTSASRFSQLTTLDYDHNGQVVSASVQVLLFEKTRVVRRPEGEPTFHVFYQLLAGVDAKLRADLQLTNLSEPNLFMTPLQKIEDKQKAILYWSKIYAAMKTLSMSEDEILSICSVLASIYHLGVAGANKGNNNKGQFAKPASAQRAATLLGISVEELARNIFSSSGSATLSRNTSMRSSSNDKQTETATTATEALEGFVIGLYSDVFNAIVSMINRSLSSTFRNLASITVLDTPGFQNPGPCGRQTGATFEDLCHNYTQEKLQLLFHDLVFTTPQDRYSQESIECDFEFVTTSPAAMVSLIEKPPTQSLLNSFHKPNYFQDSKDYHHSHSPSTQGHDSVHNNEGQHKVKVQGQHHSDCNNKSSSSSSVPTEGHFQNQNESKRCSSVSSVPALASKIPLKSMSTMKSCPPSSPEDHPASGHYNNHVNHDEVRTATAEVRESEKKGLLWILDEEAIFPGATEDSFMDRFFSYHGEQKVKKDSLLRKASSLGNTFILNHFQGTNPVQYNASGWLKVCRENPISKVATQVLQDSKKANIKELFNSVKAPVGGMVSGSIVGMEGSTTLRRVGSMRRTFMSGTSALKKRSMCLQVKFQVDTIIETLRKTKCHFIHCVLPQVNAGLCELKNTPDGTPEKPDDILMNVPLVRLQFRGNEILDSVRIHRQGFPDHVTYGEFIQKFIGLVPLHVRPSADVPEKQAVQQLLEHLDIDKLSYRIGLSKVFFRAGALNRLESSRDDRVTDKITLFQAYCRGYIARKRLAKLRVQHVAISCIQKNVRKFYQIRDWDWWKLYVKVKPLLNVHRTEEELKEKELELEQMKTKLEKIEKERNEYKQQMDKLENRVVELQADLAEENTTATQASEMLETEGAERMRLEKELKDVQTKYNALKRNHEKIEMEMTQLRLWQVETVDGETEQDDLDAGIYKERYEKLRKEMTFNKKQMQQQHEEEMEQERNAKKAIEKRLHEALEDAEEMKRQLAAGKKKLQKLLSETQDSKLHLEEQMAHNNDLERKQRRFDQELSKAHDETKIERTVKEKLQREKDALAAEKYTIEKDLERMKSDMESAEAKYERLQRELGETSSGVKDDHELTALKRAKADLEAKVIDQEEELDDQAGQIQQLEQTKVRLEMNLEKARQQQLKEIEEKDQDMEDLRYSTQKKLKQMEVQMEEDYEERKILMQKNREMEQRLQDMHGQSSVRDKGAEKRLRRSLHKTKALLKDAEVVLQKQNTGEGSKMQVRQLRNQLEDAEYASAAAVKAKKTMELELADLQQQLEELFKSKQEAENKSMTLLREKTEIQSQLEENEEDMADTMKKYKAVVQQQTLDQITLNDQLAQIEELISERDKLKSEVNDLRTRVQTFEENSADKTVVQRLENRIRDLEARLELEITNKHRQEVLMNRMKEQINKMSEEKEQLAVAKTQAEENIKKVQRQLRDLREEFSDVQKREMEVSHKLKENENKVAELESDFQQNQSDLKLAFKRIADLQHALEEGIESDYDFSDSELDDSESDIESFLASHRPSSLGHEIGSYGSEVSRSSSCITTDTPSSPQLTNSLNHNDESHFQP